MASIESRAGPSLVAGDTLLPKNKQIPICQLTIRRRGPVASAQRLPGLTCAIPARDLDSTTT